MFGTKNTAACENVVPDALVLKTEEGARSSPLFNEEDKEPAFMRRYEKSYFNSLEVFY